MNPFEYFQKLKPDILANEAFMKNLKMFAFGDILRLVYEDKLISLGSGRHNAHFRIGKVNDIWLATREYINISCGEEDDIQHCEIYISESINYHNEGKRVPLVCGGVKAEQKRGNRYFLLVEDLTQGGTADFKPAPPSGEIHGSLNGEDIYHDFDAEKPYWIDIKYMKPENLITLSQ